MIKLEDLQQDIAAWRIKNFGPMDGTAVLKKATEEIGELWAGHATRNRTEQVDGVGDVVVALIGYCAESGLDFQECLKFAWDQVKTRDYRKYPGKGRP